MPQGTTRSGRCGMYPPLEQRERKAREAKERKGRTAERKVGREQRAEQDEVDKGIDMGAALQRVMDKHESIESARENHTAAVSEYLKPYLKKLNALERSMRLFPSNVQIPWADIESDVLDPTSPENIREIGDRFGVDRKALYDMSKKRKWTARRAVVMELYSRTSTVKAIASTSHAMVGGDGNPAASIAEDEEVLVGLVKTCLGKIAEALNKGTIAFRSAGDIDKIVRLLLVVQGKADSIRENRDRITPAQLETIAAKVAKNLKVDVALAGLVVQPREAEFEVLDEPAEIETAAEA